MKHADFRIVLTVLQSKAGPQEHKAAGRISVRALAGHIRPHVGDGAFDPPTGHLLALERMLPHDVEASENSTLLPTIRWPQESEKS